MVNRSGLIAIEESSRAKSGEYNKRGGESMSNVITVGQPASEFTLKDQDQKEISLGRVWP